jgi:hypothetical protein
MEDRSTWDYLTACLYHGPLDQPDTLWALVRHEELVRATESEAFKEAVAAHSELIRGPSPALRIRNHLDKKGLLLRAPSIRIRAAPARRRPGRPFAKAATSELARLFLQLAQHLLELCVV